MPKARWSELSGVVVDDRNQPAPDAWLVLFPLTRHGGRRIHDTCACYERMLKVSIGRRDS